LLFLRFVGKKALKYALSYVLIIATLKGYHRGDQQKIV
jgi:hypothetical protein